MSQDPVSMLEKYVEAFNAGDFETLVDFYHDDLYLNVSRGTELRGKQSVVDHYTSVRSMSQRTMTIDRAFSSGTNWPPNSSPSSLSSPMTRTSPLAPCGPATSSSSTRSCTTSCATG